MYDPKSEAHEFLAESRTEALAAATRFFDVPEEKLLVRELTGIAGAASRTLIVAQPQAAVGQARSGPDSRESRGRERGGRERGGRGERGDRERGGRGRERDAGRGGRGRSRVPEATPGASSESREGPEPRQPTGPSKGRVEGEAGSVGEFLVGLIERMELGPFELAKVEEDRHSVFQVRGEAAEAISAAEARTVEAIQLLVNQSASRTDPDAKRVVVDIEGDREKRESYLARLADRAVKRAREAGRSVALDPMNGRDRREVHMALRDAEGVATMSIGEGRYRQVLVVPEGAPEYEEACEAAEAAARAED